MAVGSRLGFYIVRRRDEFLAIRGFFSKLLVKRGLDAKRSM